MMRKTFLMMIATTAILWSCGDAGVQSDISQNVAIDPITVQLSVPPILVGQQVDETPPINVNSGVIDISGEDFEEYLDDAERFTLNEITYSIEGFPAGSQADLQISVAISVEGGTAVDLLTTTIPDAQNNATDAILYPSANANQAGVNALENALLNGQSFEMDIELIGRDVTLSQSEVEFDLIFRFDVTARVQF